VLSEDDLSDPKEIRFADKGREVLEKDLIKEGGGQTQVILATASLVLPMGNVAAGKWFYLYGDNDFSLSIDGGPALSIPGGKPCEMWADFTSLSVTAGANDLRLTWGIGGE
jgi:hypothetical protein